MRESVSAGRTELRSPACLWPMGGTAIVHFRTAQSVHADVAQLVAHNLAKVRVASSSLVIRSTLCLRGYPEDVGALFHPRAFSSAGERFPDTEEVTGSIPVSRTSRSPEDLV